jgi:hypothetical protein
MRTIGMIPPEYKATETNTETSTTVDYTDMKKSELIALCDERGIELTATAKRSKAALIEALESED